MIGYDDDSKGSYEKRPGMIQSASGSNRGKGTTSNSICRDKDVGVSSPRTGRASLGATLVSDECSPSVSTQSSTSSSRWRRDKTDLNKIGSSDECSDIESDVESERSFVNGTSTTSTTSSSRPKASGVLNRSRSNSSSTTGSGSTSRSRQQSGTASASLLNDVEEWIKKSPTKSCVSSDLDDSPRTAKKKKKKIRVIVKRLDSNTTENSNESTLLSDQLETYLSEDESIASVQQGTGRSESKGRGTRPDDNNKDVEKDSEKINRWLEKLAKNGTTTGTGKFTRTSSGRIVLVQQKDNNNNSNKVQPRSGSSRSLLGDEEDKEDEDLDLYDNDYDEFAQDSSSDLAISYTGSMATASAAATSTMRRSLDASMNAATLDEFDAAKDFIHRSKSSVETAIRSSSSSLRNPNNISSSNNNNNDSVRSVRSLEKQISSSSNNDSNRSNSETKSPYRMSPKLTSAKPSILRNSEKLRLGSLSMSTSAASQTELDQTDDRFKELEALCPDSPPPSTLNLSPTPLRGHASSSSSLSFSLHRRSSHRRIGGGVSHSDHNRTVMESSDESLSDCSYHSGGNNNDSINNHNDDVVQRSGRDGCGSSSSSSHHRRLAQLGASPVNKRTKSRRVNSRQAPSPITSIVGGTDSKCHRRSEDRRPTMRRTKSERGRATRQLSESLSSMVSESKVHNLRRHTSLLGQQHDNDRSTRSTNSGSYLPSGLNDTSDELRNNRFTDNKHVETRRTVPVIVQEDAMDDVKAKMANFRSKSLRDIVDGGEPNSNSSNNSSSNNAINVGKYFATTTNVEIGVKDAPKKLINPDNIKPLRLKGALSPARRSSSRSRSRSGSRIRRTRDLSSHQPTSGSNLATKSYSANGQNL